MKVAVVCEFSGTVRDAFAARGHDAISFDLLPSERPGAHVQGDCRAVDFTGFDLAICHPPCTHLAVSGARWFKDKVSEQSEALLFVWWCFGLPVPRLALENPVSIISSWFEPPAQIIQPWQFGHPETKATCLWLRGLPLLRPTNVVAPDFMRRPDGSYYTDAQGKRYSRIHYMSGRKDPEVRRRERSRTYTGVAKAMAEQWGALL